VRILLVGAGGVGGAFCAIAARRDFFETVVVTDHDLARAEKAAATDPRFSAAQVDASSSSSVADLVREHRITHVMNAVDPRFVMPVFEGALAGGADYLDMAMSLSRPHPSSPYSRVGVKLGDEQFAQAEQWEGAGRLALCGIGVEPGLSDVFARYAADHLFSEIDEVGVRDGANLTVEGHDFAPSFSIWTTIEECLNPPVVWEKARADVEPEVFDFPDGIGPVECVNVEHEEVLLMPRWVDAKRATFKYGLGEEFIDVLRTLHKLGLDSTDTVRAGGVEVSPRDVVAACLPDPATLGDRMRGKTCAGLQVTGTGTDGRPRSTSSTTSSTTSGPCGSTATSAWCGRPRSTRSSRSSCWPPGPGRAAACSAPRRSTRCRSWTCSPTTGHPGASATTDRTGARRGVRSRAWDEGWTCRGCWPR
jgi:saccharopine dehydrogenase (NAD+, L-lysine-forming)